MEAGERGIAVLLGRFSQNLPSEFVYVRVNGSEAREARGEMTVVPSEDYSNGKGCFR